MNSENNKDHLKVQIRESIVIPLIIVSIIIYFIGAALYNMTVKANDIGLPTYLLTMTAVALLMFSYVLAVWKQSKIMSLADEGIYLGNSKLVRWDSILSIKRRTERSGEGGKYLVLQTIHSAEPLEIDISNMAMSEKKLLKEIQKFRHYNINKVDDYYFN